MERGKAFLAGVERWMPWFPALFAVLYLVAFGLIARSRPRDYDEIIVEHLIRLPAFSDTLAALREGEVDKVSPLSYAMTRLQVAVFGGGPVAFRAPEILAGLIAAVCIYRFTARRAPPVYAAVAMVFLFATQARWHAYYARPGILAVAAIALGLVAWQGAAEGRRRPLSVLVLGGSLATAVGMHYYAVVSVVPLAIGELVRAYGRRRVDLPVWLALAAPAVPLLVFLPFIRGGMRQLDTFFAKPSWDHVWEFYPWLVNVGIGSTSLRYLLVVAAGVGLIWWLGKGLPGLPPHEAVAIWALALAPAFGAALAMTVTGTFTPRYAITGVVGVTVLLGWTAARWWRGSFVLGLLLLIAVGTWTTAVTYRSLSRVRVMTRTRAETVAMIRARATDERPIVVSYAFEFLELSHDAPPELARRLVFLVDRDAAIQQVGNDTQERVLTGLARRAPIDVRDYAPFVASGQEFWLYAPRRPDNWIGRVLAREPTLRLIEQGRHQAGVLYLVSPR